MEQLKHVNYAVTTELKNYVRQVVLESTEMIIIREENGKNIGNCTRCQNEFEIEEQTHNKYINCPICGARVQAKKEGYGRKTLKTRAMIYTFEKSILDRKTIVCKAFTFIRDDYQDYKNMQDKYLLEAVYIFGEKNSSMYMKNYNGEFSKRATIFSVDNIKTGVFGNAKWDSYVNINSFKVAVKGTMFQYSMLEKVMLECRGNYIDTLLKYLELYSKNKLVESLIKIGFSKLIIRKIRKETLYSTCNWKGKTIYEILKLDKATLKEVIKDKKELSVEELKILQIAKKQKSKIKLEEIIEIAEKYEKRIFSLEKALKYTKIEKLNRYLDRQKEQRKDVYKNIEEVLTTYLDYIQDLKKLEIDITDKRILYPKNLMEEHLRLTTQIKYKENVVLSKKISLRRKELDKYKYSTKEFIIRPVRSYKEIVLEGKKLGHCVASYATRYAEKKTDIFVLRKREDAGTPFYTVEIAKGEIVQVRGKANRAMTEEVEAFIEEFKKEKLEIKEIKNKIA